MSFEFQNLGELKDKVYEEWLDIDQILSDLHYIESELNQNWTCKDDSQINIKHQLCCKEDLIMCRLMLQRLKDNFQFWLNELKTNNH